MRGAVKNALTKRHEELLVRECWMVTSFGVIMIVQSPRGHRARCRLRRYWRIAGYGRL